LNILTRNFGLTIILFTIVVRLALYPFYHAQTKQMIQMRKIQPAVDAIRKKYKDPQKQQEELMKIYKENKINPSSGCLMLLVQLPIFALLYGVIQSYQELFSVSGGFLIWKDLSGRWLGSKLVVLGHHDTNFILSCIDHKSRFKNGMATDNNGLHIPILLHQFTKRLYSFTGR